MKTTFNLFVLFFLLIHSTNVVCHGDLDIRIQNVSEEITNFPDSAFLYFKRGKLYFQHEEYFNAVNDIETANNLGYQDVYLHMIKAECLLQLDSLDEALYCITPIQETNPELALPYKILGKIYFQMGKYVHSALSWEKAINKTRRRTPEDYIAASNSWFAAGDNQNYQQGIKILDDGLNHFSNIQSLLIHKRDAAIDFFDFEIAGRCQLQIIEQSKRKEFPHFELGKIYESAGRKDLALEQYRHSRAALNQLPSHIRSNKSIRLLENELNQKLNQVKN